MIKKILILLFLLLITAYLIVAVTAFNTKPADQVCKGMELIIKDSIDHGFISQKGILRLLNGKKLSPVGKKMGDINTRLLEEELSQHPLIENVECYRTPGWQTTETTIILTIKEKSCRYPTVRHT